VPSPIQRDPAATSAALASWLERTLPESAGAVVTRLDAPPSSGFSGETILLDAEWGGSSHELVIRVAPTTYTVFLECVREHGSYQLIRQEMAFGGTPQHLDFKPGAELGPVAFDYRKVGQ